MRCTDHQLSEQCPHEQETIQGKNRRTYSITTAWRNLKQWLHRKNSQGEQEKGLRI